jgi:hypothetical protein
MKKRCALLIAILSPLFLNAQDTIIKTNGDHITSKILEVSTIEVKYKKFDFQDGPTYIENISNIYLIKYSNGSMEKFRSQEIKSNDVPIENQNDYYTGPLKTNDKIERYGNHFRFQGEAIDEHKLHDVLFKSKDKQLISLAGNAKDAKGLQYIGFGAIPLGVGALYFLSKGFFSNPYYGGPTTRNLTLSAICFVGAISCPIASIYFKNKRNYSNREAIRLYNERY